MPLDHYKTQVLLLHSEQSTLDSLSSGFSDRYTVHCATSGSEALNTLVDTPINVIISAQDLPGMSGLEALREAKKRSPETIGILLAGKGDEGLEALVGDKEVFQVVRGQVTGDSLRKLVDNATQQIRLMALAESANDTAANVDEPAEHIVMETSENGSAIISDGTGQMRALNPDKISAAVASGSRSIDILVLTKDQEFLTTIKESSRGMHTVHYANTLAQADETIRKHKVGVAVVDAAMVGEKVEQLTQHLRKGSARLVSIVAGRRDDGEMLMDLINRGKVYRFLLKPVSPGRARLAVEASVKHHIEAPDAAFRLKVTPADSRQAAKPELRPQPKPAAKPAPAPAAKAKPAPKPTPAIPKATARTAPPKLAPADPPLGDPTIESPINKGLSSAFGDDDTSFTETVTGLISSFTKKGTGDAQAAPAPHAETAMNLEPVAPTGGSGGSLVKNAKVIGIAAAAILVIASALFWFIGGDDDVAPVAEPVATSTPSVTEEDVVFDAPVPSGRDAEALADEARLARDAGQIFNPAGSNAIELFAAAVAADPSNAVIAAELDAVVEQALSMAETALLETRIDDAVAALERAAFGDADHPRLPFLTAQLSQVQLRGHLTDARAAIRDERFEDAANALAAAKTLGTADITEIDEVAHELSSARIEQRVDEVLALANARLEEGDLLSPANDNARYYYELVLSNDSSNTAARQGLNVIASKLVLQARSGIDSGRLDEAEQLLSDARAIDASNSELNATDAALIDARDAMVARQQRRAAEASRQAEAERQAEADRRAAEIRAEEERIAEEERLAEEQRLAEEALAVSAAVQEAPAKTTGETADAAADSGITETVADADVEMSAAEAEEPTTAAAAADTTEGPSATNVLDQTPITISALNRTRYVAPKYPRAALRRNQSGWVDVAFTVTLDGTVTDLEIRNAEPADVFDAAAIRAVEKWEFEPVFEDGVAVEKRAGVRMMFALE